MNDSHATMNAGTATDAASAESSATNARLVERFYTAFGRRDVDAMLGCYHPQVVFSDPVFGTLAAADAAPRTWSGPDCMARYRSAPSFPHDRPTRLGVLLINLGTPDAPTTAAVRRYLAQFLSDPRVIEIPRALWAPFLHGVILNSRPAKSAQKYATVWTKDGSPLLVHSLRQKTLMQGYLGQRLKDLGLPSDFAQVALGMRYGQPSIASAMANLEAEGCDRVLVLPLYPQ